METDSHRAPSRLFIAATAAVVGVAALLVPRPAAGDSGAGSAGTSLVLVSGGSYLQGDTTGAGYPDEYPTRQVTVSSFYLAALEVTFAQYDQFCEQTGTPKPADNGWGRQARPAIYVSWLDAAQYCNWLSQREGLAPFYAISGQSVAMDWSSPGYRLPTEAEWEYAARGGSSGAASPPGGLDATAWYSGNAGGTTHPVGEKSPNALGLYDMGGNVWEWCNDWYAQYPALAAEDPRGPDQGQYRALRGGSWYDAVAQRPSARIRHPPTMRLPMLGFRVARSAPPGSRRVTMLRSLS